MPSTKIVFPPPPPTTNSLTFQQRKQLQRSTKKLAHVLGSTPQLLDASDAYGFGYLAGPFVAYRDEPYPDSSRRGSMDSLKSSLPSTSSAPMSSRSATPVSTLSRSSSTSRSYRGHRSSKSSISKLPTRPPLLRIAFNSEPVLSTPLETIPASPISPPPHAFTSFSETLSGTILDNSPSYSIRPSRTPSPRDSLVDPDFIIPTQTALRKRKLDRLRRMLGDDVPQELIFPQQPSLDFDGIFDEEKTLVSGPPSPKFTVSSEHFTIPVLPPTPASSPSKSPRNNSRDSLTLPSVHRANRSKRVPVPTFDPSLPTTYTTIQISSGVPRVQRTSSTKPTPATKDKSLRSIIECPDEHGSGCAEEFTFFSAPAIPKPGQRHPYASAASPYVDAPLSLSMKTDGVSVKLWSTRKGYEGWTQSSVV